MRKSQAQLVPGDDVARMLKRAMDVIHDLVYGGEDFSAAEELLNEWEPVSRPEMVQALTGQTELPPDA